MNEQNAREISETLSEILPEQEAVLLIGKPQYDGLPCHFEAIPVRRAGGWKVMVRRVYSFRTLADIQAAMNSLVNEATGIPLNEAPNGASIDDEDLPF